MDLLKYEFSESGEGSFNYMLSQLISKLRFYTTNVPVEEFRAALPQLKLLEGKLQNFDMELGLEERNYIEEVMNEFQQEAAIKDELMNEIERSSHVIMKDLYNIGFFMKELSIDFVTKSAVYWLEFHNYNTSEKEQIGVLKEVVKTICYKLGVVFIDKSI